MGKVYRIPHSHPGTFLAPEYRGVLGMAFCVSLIVTLALTLSGISRSGHTALGLLVTPMLVILVAGLFQEQMPRVVTTILCSLALLALLACVTAIVLWVHYYHCSATAPECKGYCGSRMREWEYVLLLRRSYFSNFIEFLPLMLSTFVYLFALVSQLRVIGRTDAS